MVLRRLDGAIDDVIDHRREARVEIVVRHRRDTVLQGEGLDVSLDLTDVLEVSEVALHRLRNG